MNERFFYMIFTRYHSTRFTRAVWALALVGAASVGATTGDVWREATLYRDEWGIPHVYADNPFALAFAFGHAQAEDHAEHMLLAYRMANGRLAAVLGEAHANSDAFSLKMGHARLAEAALANAAPITRALCEGFAMGVNAWLVDHADAMPAWADGVKPADVLALWHAFIMSMAPFDLPDAYRRPPAMTSGNAWAMAPERSTEGRATLVTNPHQHHNGFFQWYEAHLVMGDMNMYGATLRGLPIIVQGHNETLGWSLTPNYPNFADMYLEEYEPPSPGNPKDPRIRQEEGGEQHALLLHYMAHSQPYHVRTGAGLETRFVPAYIGDRGPIFEHGTLGLHSWLIGGYADFGGLQQLMEMGRARSFDAFWAAMHLQQIPCFHMVYADREGNIAYLYNTKAGVRLAPIANETGGLDTSLTNHDWNAPVSQSVAGIAWREVFSPSALPGAFNPASGFVQACGNPPWTVTEPPAIDPSAWPRWLVRDVDSYRARRVRQLLRQGTRSFRDHQSMLFDLVAPAALDMVPALMRTVEARPDRTRNAHPDFWAGLELLRNWNFIAETSSPGMTFYHLWWTFARARAADAFDSETAFYDAALRGMPAAQNIMLLSVEDAARGMMNEYGSLTIPWGEVHRIRHGKHDEAMPGANSGEPIFVASDHVYDQGRWISTYGYGFAMVTQFGERTESVSLMPFGASLRTESPHYADQLALMLDRRFKRVRYHDDDILRNAQRAMGKRITLLPLGIPGAITLHAPGIIHARLRTETETPEPLPRDTIPFSLYMHPERSPAGAPVSVEVSLYIPQELCGEEWLSELQLYRYEPGLAWQPVPEQQIDRANRILMAQDAVLAQCYVALGPAHAAGEANFRDDTHLPETARHPADAVGLDALLTGHSTHTPVTSERRRFHIERHDDATPRDVEPTEEEAPPKPEPMPDHAGRVFHLERLDEVGTSETPHVPGIPHGIPGYHFGPHARPPTDDDAPSTRTFQMERHDQPQADEQHAETPEAQAQAPAAVTPSRLPEAPAAEMTPEAPAPAPTPVATPEYPLTDAITQQRERPPLPDVIPQDPAFIFGPARKQQESAGAANTEGRLFHIERHE